MPKYNPTLDDKDSIYYWGMDTKYKPTSSKPKPRSRSGAEFDIGLDGVPYRVKGSSKNQSGRKMAYFGDDYKRQELRASGKLPGLPADYKKTELAAGQAAEDFREGAGFPGQTPTRTNSDGEGLTGRDSRRGNSSGTQMSPIPANFDDFQKVLESKGVSFNFGQGRMGMQSNSLPVTPGNSPDTSSGNIVRITNGQNEGNYVKVDNPDFDKIIRGEMAGGFAGSQGAQSGASSAADVGDQMSSLRFDPSKYVKDDERPDDIYETADVGLDARSRAFLDGPDDSMLALRNAEAAQGTIKQNGKVYAKGSDGNWIALSDEGAAGLKADRNQVASQDYADKFKNAVKTAAQEQSPDSGNPLPATRQSYEDIAESNMGGTLYVPSDSNRAETFSPNASAVTGNPAQFGLADSDTDYFTQKPTGEPNKSWLPTEDEFKEREEMMRLMY